MQYNRLRYRIDDEDRDRVIENLMSLRNQLDNDVPKKDADHHLLLGTWNIRDLGKDNRRGHGERLSESHFYIAEIISRFDMVAVQEVNALDEWAQVMDILGSNWDYIATDVTDWSLGGNGERLTFVFDKRKVQFENIAGEIVLPTNLLVSKVEFETEDGDERIAGRQFRRTPFFTRFQSGWLKFDLCTVHIYYGDRYGDKLDQRVEEIERVANYMSERADESLRRGRATILLGDFNIKYPNHKTMKALTDSGFVVPEPLQQKTNVKKSKFYDQIAFKTSPEVVEFVEEGDDQPQKNAGVLEVMKSVFTKGDFAQYMNAVRNCKNGKKKESDDELEKYYKNKWRTYQMSDHNLLWTRLKTNDSDGYLQYLLHGND